MKQFRFLSFDSAGMILDVMSNAPLTTFMM
jgi:hypothetical protein